ncbi:MAG: PrsW family glutamic-type intramembrane protease [Actinomycetes bacterium]
MIGIVLFIVAGAAAVLLICGTWAAAALWRAEPDQPPAAWSPDPTTKSALLRFWDGQAWTSAVAPAGAPTGRGRLFWGRFWGWWALVYGGGVAVTLAGSVLYLNGGSVPVFALTSAVAMSVLFAAFGWFVARQLNLAEVVTVWQVVAAVIAGAGASILIAGNINDLISHLFGVKTALATVGIVEESTKLLVPLVLYALVRYRNPRAGIAVGLASAAGFGIAEATSYAIVMPHGTAVNPCSPAMVSTTSPDVTVGSEFFRLLTVEPLHLFWTGIAVAVVWRLWRHYGRARVTPAVVGAVLLPMALHSSFDSTSDFACGNNPGLDALLGLLKVLLFIASYLLFKFFVSQSTPPDIVASVSSGWHPSHLKSASPGVRDPAGNSGTEPAAKATPDSDSGNHTSATP